MKERRHYMKFTDGMKRAVRRFVIYGQYSPDWVCGRFRLKGKEMVCIETIAIGYGRTSAVVMTSWHTISCIEVIGDGDATAYTVSGQSSRIGLTYPRGQRL